MSKVGDVIAQMLRERGMTQAELARRIGRHQSYIALLVNGYRTNPSDQVVYRMAQAFGVPYHVFCQMIDRTPAVELDLEFYIREMDPHRLNLLRDIVALTDEQVEVLSHLIKLMVGDS